jgi:hypothetical protein
MAHKRFMHMKGIACPLACPSSSSIIRNSLRSLRLGRRSRRHSAQAFVQ